MIEFVGASSRAKAYRSNEFQREIGQILRRDRRDIRLYLDALLKADRLPVVPTGTGLDAAVATEAARILSAVASRQIKDTSVVRVTDRILGMPHRCDVVEGDRNVASANRLGTFQDDLAAVLRNVWEASEGMTATLPFPPHIAVTWNDNGAALYGHIKDTKGKMTALYSTAGIPAGAWDFVRTYAVGGSGFTPLALLGFAECMRDAAREDD